MVSETSVKEMENRDVTDITFPNLYRPHSLITVTLMSVILIAACFYRREMDDEMENSLMGLKVAVVLFIILGTFILPYGPFIRPHPIVWNVGFAFGIVYFLFLVFLSFQTHEKALKLVNMVNNDSGYYVDYKLYAHDCRLTVKNLWDTFYDIFFVAHFLGWLAKALIFRNRIVCWVLSIYWELIEYSLIFFLPNFKECWWDSIIMDILIANALGIELGLYLGYFLEMKKYKWTSILEIESIWGKIKRAVLQFSPESWYGSKWHTTSTIKRFAQVNFLAMCLLITEINAFTVKAALRIPPSNRLNVFRAVLWFSVGLPAVRQYYIYISEEKCQRMGSMTIVAVMIMIAETLISVKFGSSSFPKIPMTTIVLWVVYIAIYLIGCSFCITKLKNKKNKT